MRVLQSHKRRWFQYSLRSLLVVMLLLGLLLSHIAHRARRQHRLVSEITQRGGYVGYDWEPESALWVSNHSPVVAPTWPENPPGPKWLRDLIGDEYFQEVVCVRLRGTATDADLEMLTDLDELRLLRIDGSSAVTDDGLKHVGRIHGLEKLWLGGTSITDHGLEHLRGLKKLKDLDLRATQITDVGARHLVSLQALRSLLLDGTQITDSGIRDLCRLKSLKCLSLSRTQLTDSSVPKLCELENLDYLGLTHTRIGQASVAKLRDALPHCYIEVDRSLR